MNAVLMTDIDTTTLSREDVTLLQNPASAGVILFKKNIQSPEQVRTLTDAIRTIRSDLLVTIDQEGGRVARLRDGFTPLPAMGQLGSYYHTHPKAAIALAKAAGLVMAAEVLAVGINLSFAPVLDIDNGSTVIGDRAFHQTPAIAALLATSFIDGMNQAGMKATGKHFPGHGSVAADSHHDNVCDTRPLVQIRQQDMAVFVQLLPKLHALMPAHVVFSQVDSLPVGFSPLWLKTIIREQLGFDGVLFSDDLSMKAAHVAGTMDKRVMQALQAGCDVALVCNDRLGAKLALHTLSHWSESSSTNARPDRLHALKARIPPWQGDLTRTCQAFFADYDVSKALLMGAFA